ncbi:GntR family transcriptional regulator [Streptomyces avermitilis]|uniref:GntR family transcriptional regulator n=1 Tax=Streptomyces avermitilis TaxID=33903 RepID=UPI0033A0A9A6
MTKTEPLGAVRERVLADLRQEIIAGRLRPGDRLVERERAERFGVSRAPVHEALEVYAAGLAASRATPQAPAGLAELLDRAATATHTADAEAITDINTRFHDRILARAANSLLISVMEPVDGRLRRLTRQNEEWPQLLKEHRESYEAIASGDRDRARAHALSHVQANHRSMVRHLFGAAGNEGEL